MTFSLCKIYVDEEKIRKQFKDSTRGINKFFSELFVYFHIDKFKLDYVPKLINFSTEEYWFEISNVGVSLDKVYYRKSKRHLNHKLRELHNQFKEDTDYFHNDIRYKNVCLKDGKYFLIDFENANFGFKDKNDDLILNESYSNQFER